MVTHPIAWADLGVSVGGGDGGGGGYPEVETHADLPAAAAHTGEVYLVRTTTGAWWTLNLRQSGLWRSTGSAWIKLSDSLLLLRDDSFAVRGGEDTSRAVRVDLGGVTTGTTVTLSIPDRSGELILDDDARLSDARAPSAHADHHAAAGGDPLAPADIGAESAGAAAAAVAAHEAAGDPHPAYTTAAEAAAAAPVQSVFGRGGDVVPEGNDLLSILTSVAPLPLGPTALTGTLNRAARRDHVHPYPTAAEVGAAAADHTHDATALGAIPASAGYVLRSRQVFAASGTYAPPAGLRAVDVQVIGGGGGGGAALDVSGACGGGGYGGGYARRLILAADLAATVSVTVGAGGAGAGGGGGPGTAGGTSSFGAHASATGGAGGATGTTAANTYDLAAIPGAGVGGQVNISGGAGGLGLTAIPIGGAGGNSPMGYGTGAPGYTSGGPGLAGRGYGGGGGGGARAGANRSGGAGSAGVVIIEEYF